MKGIKLQSDQLFYSSRIVKENGTFKPAAEKIVGDFGEGNFSGTRGAETRLHSVKRI